jgi:SAM-dependent methyltransferase
MESNQKPNETLKSVISQMMKKHYESTFQRHGPNSAGVDWGKDVEKAILRYKIMLAVLDSEPTKKVPTLLDVGCGYGGLQIYAQQTGIKTQYTGIDVASNMIAWGRDHVKPAEFIEGDFLNTAFSENSFDYIICNGILTQKLESSLLDMDHYAKMLINKMYSLCKKAIAFNIMSTSVNYFSPNLYYKHPAEILTYCLSEISKKVKIDHSYGLYEFTVYLYK